MATRRLVSPEIWAGHYDASLDEREIARHYTLPAATWKLSAAVAEYHLTRLRDAVDLYEIAWPRAPLPNVQGEDRSG